MRSEGWSVTEYLDPRNIRSAGTIFKATREITQPPQKFGSPPYTPAVSGIVYTYLHLRLYRGSKYLCNSISYGVRIFQNIWTGRNQNREVQVFRDRSVCV